MSRQLAFVAVFSTHASSVIADVRWSDAVSGIVTRLLEPLKFSAPPYLPIAQLVFAVVPLLPAPEASVTDVPDPSLKPSARTRPGVAAEVGPDAEAKPPMRTIASK